MAMAQPLTPLTPPARTPPTPAWLRSSWNPLRITDTRLHPQLLLMAKLVVIGLVLKGYWHTLPDVFAPLLPVMDALPEPWFYRSLKALFAIAATGLMFNRAVRTNCIIIGCVFLAATLSSRVYYRNAKFFVALLFILTGLQERGKEPFLIWWQLALMYFGAGLNKLTEPDWRSGHFFDYYLGALRQSDLYTTLDPLLPQGYLAWTLCWSVITIEFTAAALLLFRRTRPTALWLAASLHAGAAILVADDYGIFLLAVLASYLSCLHWPDPQQAHLHTTRPNHWLHTYTRWLDHDQIFNPHPAPPPTPPTPNTDTDTPHTDDHTTTLTAHYQSHTWHNWRAAGACLLWTPAPYFLAAILLAATHGGPTNAAIVRSAGIITAAILAAAFLHTLHRHLRRPSS